MDKKEILKELEKIKKSIRDIPKMEEIQKNIDKILLKSLEEINGYLIDERDKVESNMAKEQIEELIKSNYAQIVRIKERK